VMSSKVIKAYDESEMTVLGERLLQQLPLGVVVFLQGQLGAGKTTLVRAALRGQGFTGAVKSPTYTLVETYEIDQVQVAHFDLYRLGDPEELEYMGYREYFNSQSVCFIEWPDKGVGMLPAPDLIVDIQVHADRREVTITAKTPLTDGWLSTFEDEHR